MLKKLISSWYISWHFSSIKKQRILTFYFSFEQPFQHPHKYMSTHFLRLTTDDDGDEVSFEESLENYIVIESCGMFFSILEKGSSYVVIFLCVHYETATMCELTMAWIDYYRVLAHETHSIICHEIYCTRTSSIVHLAFANDKSSVCSPTQHDIITHLCLLTDWLCECMKGKK